MQEPTPPPIVSPFSDYGDKTPSPSGKWKRYAQMFAWAVLTFALLLLLNRFVGLGLVGLFAIAIYVVAAIYLTFLVFSLGKRLQFCVRSHDDLQQIRRVVDMNMKFAFLFTSVMFAFMAAFLVSRIWGCLILLSVTSIFLSPILLRVESKFRAMEVTSEDPTVAAEFKNIIAQWKEPKFGLS